MRIFYSMMITMLCLTMLVSCFDAENNVSDDESYKATTNETSSTESPFEGDVTVIETETVSVTETFSQHGETNPLCVAYNGDVRLFLIDSCEKYNSVSVLFEKKDGITETFFDENTLIVASLYSSSSAYWYEYDSASVSSGKLYFNFACKHSPDDEVVLPMSVETYRIFCVDKSQIQDCQEYEAVIITNESFSEE